MSPFDAQLILDELRKLHEVFHKGWAKLDDVLESSRSTSVPTQSAVISTAVVADNWGGLFDGGDDSDEEHGEARSIVADNWDGLFEQPAHVRVEPVAIDTADGADIFPKFAPADHDLLPGAESPADIIFAGFASTEQIHIDSGITSSNSAASTPFAPDTVFEFPDGAVGDIHDICVDAVADEFLRLSTTEEKPTIEREKVQIEAQAFSLVVPFKQDSVQIRDREFVVGALSAPRPPRQALLRPPPLRRPRRAPPRPPWVCRPRSPRTCGPRRTPPWQRRPLRRLIWRPPWRLASFDRRSRRRGHRVLGGLLRLDPDAGDALRAGCLTKYLVDAFCPNIHQDDSGIELICFLRGDVLHRFEYGDPTAAFLAKLRGGLLVWVAAARSAEATWSTNCPTQDRSFTDVLVGVFWEEKLHWNDLGTIPAQLATLVLSGFALTGDTPLGLYNLSATLLGANLDPASTPVQIPEWLTELSVPSPTPFLLHLVVPEKEDDVPSTLPNRCLMNRLIPIQSCFSPRFCFSWNAVLYRQQRPWRPPTELWWENCDAGLHPLLWPSFNSVVSRNYKIMLGQLDDIDVVGLPVQNPVHQALHSDSTQLRPIPWPPFSTYAVFVQLKLHSHGIQLMMCERDDRTWSAITKAYEQNDFLEAVLHFGWEVHGAVLRQPWPPPVQFEQADGAPVQFEQADGVQFRCVLSDFAVHWKYVIIPVRFIGIPVMLGISLLGHVALSTPMLSYEITILFALLKTVNPGSFLDSAKIGTSLGSFTVVVWMCCHLLWKPPWELPALVVFIDDGRPTGPVLTYTSGWLAFSLLFQLMCNGKEHWQFKQELFHQCLAFDSSLTTVRQILRYNFELLYSNHEEAGSLCGMLIATEVQFGSPNATSSSQSVEAFGYAVAISSGSLILLSMRMASCALIDVRVQRKSSGLICIQSWLPPAHEQFVQMEPILDISTVLLPQMPHQPSVLHQMSFCYSRADKEYHLIFTGPSVWLLQLRFYHLLVRDH